MGFNIWKPYQSDGRDDPLGPTESQIKGMCPSPFVPFPRKARRKKMVKSKQTYRRIDEMEEPVLVPFRWKQSATETFSIEQRNNQNSQSPTMEKISCVFNIRKGEERWERK